MVYQFVVTLKNTQARAINLFSTLLLGVSWLLFVREGWLAPRHKILFLVLDFMAILAFVYVLLLKKRNPRLISIYGLAMLMASLGWMWMPYFQWLWIPFLILGLLEKAAKAPLEIGFTDQQVVINTLFKQRYQWSDFNNVILRDDLLTLDFKSNRLLQRETEDEEGDAEEDEFNDYCRLQLQKARQQDAPPLSKT